jgi:hypothetical protein
MIRQVSGALRGELSGNERGYRKYERACLEEIAREFPEHRAFRLKGDMDKVGALTPGEEECEGVTESEEALWEAGNTPFMPSYTLSTASLLAPE